MEAVVLLAYGVGALLGFFVARSGQFEDKWRAFIRIQLLLASSTVAVIAAWRATIRDIEWPLVVTVCLFVIMGVAYLLTPKSQERAGRAVLRGWSAIPNPLFWLVPIATAIAGVDGAIVAVLIDRFAIVAFAIFVWVLRRNAPIKQAKKSAWIDQSPVIGVIVGFALRGTTDAPEWTADVLHYVVPVIAAIGAAIFVGSVMHPSQQVPWRSGVRVWLILTAVRIGLLVPLALIAPSGPISVALILAAFSIPAFFPIQWSVLYGYSDSVVAAAARLSWVFAPIGLLAAFYIMQTTN